MAVIIPVQIARFLRAQSQAFNIIPTFKQNIIIIFGSTGNAYGIHIKKSSLSCTCPDCTSGCKHIIFFLSALGYLKNHQSHVTINPSSILQKLSQTPMLEHIRASYLDHHTANLCSAHKYAPCFFCAKKHSSTIIICSKCGYLAHKHCYDNYVATNTDNYNPNYCPKCGLPFTPLELEFRNGYRNYYFVLKHRNYRSSITTNVDTDAPPFPRTTHNVPHSQPILEDI